MIYLVAYLATFGIHVVLEYAWLRAMIRSRLAHDPEPILRRPPRAGPVLGFGIVYAAVLTFLAAGPGLFLNELERPFVAGWIVAVLNGAVLGLMAHGTRAFGNRALLAGWRWSIVFLDLGWGVIASAAAALAGYLAGSSWVV